MPTLAGPGAGRPDLPLPPDKLPIRRGGNWRKRWRYVAAFCDEFMVCAARVQVGPLGQTFWAVWDREQRDAARAHPRDAPGRRAARSGPSSTSGERPDGSTGRPSTVAPWSGSRRRRAVDSEQRAGVPARRRGRVGRVRLPDRRGRQLHVDAQARDVPRRVRRARRRAADQLRGARGRGRVGRLPPPPHRLELVGGRRARPPTGARSAGTWSAGSTTRRSAPSARSGSTASRQRARAGRRFDDLDAIDFDDGSRLEFSAEAERSKARTGRGRQLLATASRSAPSAARCPAGSSSPSGFGVMEHHDAHW